MNEPAQLAAGAVGLREATPDSAHALAAMRRRRLVVLALTGVTYAALCTVMARIAGAGGWSVIDAILFLCFVVAAPWTVLGFWNSVIGLYLLHGRKDGLAQAAPFAEAAFSADPIRLKTAVLMTLRNEDPTRALRRLETVQASLEATGEGDCFAYFVLSDTSLPEVAAAEEAALAAWKGRARDLGRILYRRRARNTGFKAGNLHDFCGTHGRAYDLMLPLDADSLMAGETILGMVRVMQAHPRLGILQSLVVGAPSASAFARIFQFGMRHGMRPYTIGSAWWTADCGPFWGHNALVRIGPFAEHCRLPVLPGGPPLGGHILSHDQVEATLMRKAGYEVRVWPQEGGSWEENPPTLFAFSARDLRWCQGNMQYWRLLTLPGLKPMSRFQLAWAILMFLGVPATTLMIALAPLKALEPGAAFPAEAAIGLYLAFLAMYLSPKLAGLADILLTLDGVARYGGAPRFLLGATIEVVFSFLLGAVTTFRLTAFMAGLLFGRSIAWDGQARDLHGIGWPLALRGLWPPMAFGAAVCGALAFASQATLMWSLPLTVGYLVAAPFAVLTASPHLGAFMRRHGLCAIPEEISPPAEIRALESPAA